MHPSAVHTSGSPASSASNPCVHRSRSTRGVLAEQRTHLSELRGARDGAICVGRHSTQTLPRRSPPRPAPSISSLRRRARSGRRAVAGERAPVLVASVRQRREALQERRVARVRHVVISARLERRQRFTRPPQDFRLVSGSTSPLCEKRWSRRAHARLLEEHAGVQPCVGAAGR